MSDEIDRISEGKKYSCYYCPAEFEDIDPAVAVAVRNNHVRRNHPYDDE